MQTQDYERKYDGSFNHVPRTHYENFSTGYSKLTPNVGVDLNFLSTIHFQKTGRSLTGDLPWFIQRVFLSTYERCYWRFPVGLAAPIGTMKPPASPPHSEVVPAELVFGVPGETWPVLHASVLKSTSVWVWWVVVGVAPPGSCGELPRKL